jgi:hypothetical protein
VYTTDKLQGIRREEFSSNDAAIRRAFELLQDEEGYNFCIRAGRLNEDGRIIWDEPEIRGEYERHKKDVAAFVESL